jgi:hypothetical protein
MRPKTVLSAFRHPPLVGVVGVAVGVVVGSMVEPVMVSAGTLEV